MVWARSSLHQFARDLTEQIGSDIFPPWIGCPSPVGEPDCLVQQDKGFALQAQMSVFGPFLAWFPNPKT